MSVCYRGYPDFQKVEKQYRIGRPVQWGAFSSTTRSWDAAIQFTDKQKGVIFKITVLDGRDISNYSFFQTENEILLSPNHRFIVTSAMHVQDEYRVIELCQMDGTVFYS